MLKDWTKVLLKPTDTLETAINTLHSGGLRIALVVNSKNQLQGTITDGDIRRALLRHAGMNSVVTEVMRCNPTTALVTDDHDYIVSLMTDRDLLHIPLLDSDGRMIGLEMLQHVIDGIKQDNPVFLMAGGFGKRLHPLTLDTPKPLLKVGSKPILQTILERFIGAGFHNFYISTHYKADQLRNHFGDGEKWKVNIKYVHENEPLGTAGALGLLPDDVPEMPMIIMNGDLLTEVNFKQLLEYHEDSGGIATMCVREYDFQVPYGVVEANQHYIKEIVEKPVHKFFVNAGIYVISENIYSNIQSNVYLDMPELLQNHISHGGQINMYPLHEYWLDIGRMNDYEQAQVAISKIEV